MIVDLASLERLLGDGVDLQRDHRLYGGKNYSLGRISGFLDFLGHPERKWRVFHVAGSKGKGTVSYALASLLSSREGGCGLFVSPYVYDFRERFCSGFGFFGDDLYIEAGNRFEGLLREYSAIRRADASEILTVFEKYLAFAVVLFDLANVGSAVFETGLGGRYDATNALSTDCQLFTSIELEHTAILGDTKEKIAVEKAEIMKSGSEAFALRNGEEVDGVFREKARLCRVRLRFLDELFSAVGSDGAVPFQMVRLVTSGGKELEYRLPIPGGRFADDTALAVGCLDALGMLPGRYAEILGRLRIPGRFETHGDFVFDGAHTPESVSMTVDSFCRLFPDRPRTLVFGCAADKDFRSMASALVPHFDRVIVQKPGEFKTSDIGSVYREFESLREAYGFRLTLSSSPEFALDAAEKAGNPTLVTGSFYLLDVMKKALDSRRI